jgi:hypothetical protein
MFTIGESDNSNINPIVDRVLSESIRKKLQLGENVEFEEKLNQQRMRVDRNPSDKQKKAGNYRMGHININGFDITIENPKGSYRSGKDRDGKEWRVLMHNDYGYFSRTVGKDGDAIDVFIGPDRDSTDIYAVDQKIGGKFDETKVMFNFSSEEAAKDAYMSNYESDWKGFWKITKASLPVFKKWLYDGHRQRKPFFKYCEIKKAVKKERLNEHIITETELLKMAQAAVLNNVNPMRDSYHTGIRSWENVRTFKEAVEDARNSDDNYPYKDFTPEMAEEALSEGHIIVYSSKPIENGTFVSTSRQCAMLYAGWAPYSKNEPHVYSVDCKLNKVAWINVDEGEFCDLEAEAMKDREQYM